MQFQVMRYYFTLLDLKKVRQPDNTKWEIGDFILSGLGGIDNLVVSCIVEKASALWRINSAFRYIPYLY